MGSRETPRMTDSTRLANPPHILPHGHRGAGAEWPRSEFQPVELKKHSNQRKQAGTYQDLLSRTATFSCVRQL